MNNNSEPMNNGNDEVFQKTKFGLKNSKMGSALVEVFIIESNSWLFVSYPIVKLSISIPRNILWRDMWSDSKHSIAKVMSV